MVSETSAFWMIVLTALVTLMWRALPFIAFGGRRKMPAFLTSLKDVLPPAIMAVLVVYGLKDVPVQGADGLIAAVIGCASVMLIHHWKHNTILSVFLGTAVYMLVLNLL